MGEPITLRGEELYNALRTNLSSGFFELSGAAYLNLLRTEHSVQIRDSVFYDIRRQVLDIVKYEEPIGELSGDSLIPRSYMSDRHGLDLATDYLYKFKAVRVNDVTGEEEATFLSLSSNRQLSTIQAAEQLQHLINITPETTSDGYTLVGLQSVLTRL